MRARRASRSRGASPCALALVAALALSRPALGAESRDVLIVGGGSPELTRKLRAEAAYAGFRPLQRPPASGTASSPATLRVLSRQQVELSVQHAGGEGRSDQTLVARSGERESFALRVVEQLRARLVDVGWTLPEEASPAASHTDAVAARAIDAGGGDDSTASPLEPNARAGLPSPLVDAASESNDAVSFGAAGRVWLDAGIAASSASGGLDMLPHAALGARVELGAAWHARAFVLLPLGNTELEADEGEARVEWMAISATIARSLPLPAPWHARAGLGAGLLRIDARGEANDDFDGRREQLFAGACFAELSLAHELTRWLRVQASALGGLTAPRPVLRFDQREVASLGRFMGSLALGLELSWPEPAASP